MLIGMVALGSNPLLDHIPQKCEIKRGFTVVSSLDRIPEVSKEFLRNKLTIIDADKIDSEQAQHLSNPNVPLLFMRAYASPRQVIVWYLQPGGFVNLFNIVGMEPYAKDNHPVALHFAEGQRLNGSHNPCAATRAPIDGVRTF